ncbi:uncharacterized protein LOC113566264 [Drosophila persimilis]|uniref:uncharacterized protein LOC113566264 n=1 Tax=Drosophila persimilis TaxID=7234 RepID=UPI000F091186|nr:uncharacterized protein LOC113566264 [Drosophila persimilis]
MPQPKQQNHSSSTISTRERTQTIGETDMDQSVLNGLAAMGLDGVASFHGHKRELGHRILRNAQQEQQQPQPSSGVQFLQPQWMLLLLLRKKLACNKNSGRQRLKAAG